MARRSTFTDQSVTYGAIGATLAPDLLRYPPAGYRPAEDTVRLGSGADRFERAAEALMTWGIQRGVGFDVVDEPDRIGFAYGTTAEGPESGEESFMLERREDDTVWLTIRSILATRGGIHRLFAPRQRRKRRELTKRELRALHPAGGV